MSKVLIDEQLFFNIYKILCCDCENEKLISDTVSALNNKMDALIKHKTYTKYKMADAEDEREKARQDYLEQAGIQKNFRW